MEIWIWSTASQVRLQLDTHVWNLVNSSEHCFYCHHFVAVVILFHCLVGSRLQSLIAILHLEPLCRRSVSGWALRGRCIVSRRNERTSRSPWRSIFWSMEKDSMPLSVLTLTQVKCCQPFATKWLLFKGFLLSCSTAIKCQESAVVLNNYNVVHHLWCQLYFTTLVVHLALWPRKLNTSGRMHSSNWELWFCHVSDL